MTGYLGMLALHDDEQKQLHMDIEIDIMHAAPSAT